jgi:hypothetical protein
MISSKHSYHLHHPRHYPQSPTVSATSYSNSVPFSSNTHHARISSRPHHQFTQSHQHLQRRLFILLFLSPTMHPSPHQQFRGWLRHPPQFSPTPKQQLRRWNRLSLPLLQNASPGHHQSLVALYQSPLTTPRRSTLVSVVAEPPQPRKP